MTHTRAPELATMNVGFDLNGKSAVVTGASRGIGLATVQSLAAAGAHVVAGARTLTDELRSATPLAIEVDLARGGGPERLVEHARQQLGGIDLLINNVGGNPAPFDGFLSLDDHAWQRAIDVNLLSAIRATRAALPALLDREGAIVNIGSVNARLPAPNLVAYSAAKAALVNLGKALAEEFGPRGVRVNTISPGPVLTGVWTGPGSTGEALAQTLDLSQADLVDQIPGITGLSTGRMTEPSQVAALVLFLACDAARNLNGSELIIDGGMLKTI